MQKTRRATGSNEYPFEDLVSEDGEQWLDYITRQPPKLDAEGRLLEDFHLQTAVFREVWKQGTTMTPTPQVRERQMQDWKAENDRKKKVNEKNGGTVELVGSTQNLPTQVTKARKVRAARQTAEPTDEKGRLKLEYRTRFMEAFKLDGNKIGPKTEAFKEEWKAERAAAKAKPKEPTDGGE